MFLTEGTASIEAGAYLAFVGVKEGSVGVSFVAQPLINKPD